MRRSQDRRCSRARAAKGSPTASRASASTAAHRFPVLRVLLRKPRPPRRRRQLPLRSPHLLHSLRRLRNRHRRLSRPPPPNRLRLLSQLRLRSRLPLRFRRLSRRLLPARSRSLGWRRCKCQPASCLRSSTAVSLPPRIRFRRELPIALRPRPLPDRRPLHRLSSSRKQASTRSSWWWSRTARTESRST
jgi:hypothetical protein